MAYSDYAPPAPLIAVSSSQKATGICCIGFPPGWYGQYHPAPVHQWMLVMSGTVELGVTDGSMRTFPTGTILYLDDKGSKGHTTRVIGDEDLRLMVTRLE